VRLDAVHTTGNVHIVVGDAEGVGIKHVIGKKEIAPGRSNGRCASMNYHAHLHRKSSTGQSLWTAIRVSLRTLETEQNSWTAYLSNPVYVVLFSGSCASPVG